MDKGNLPPEKPQIARRTMLVPVQAIERARRIAAAFAAQGRDIDMGLVVLEAMEAFYSRLPADTREFIEATVTEQAPK